MDAIIQNPVVNGKKGIITRMPVLQGCFCDHVFVIPATVLHLELVNIDVFGCSPKMKSMCEELTITIDKNFGLTSDPMDHRDQVFCFKQTAQNNLPNLKKVTLVVKGYEGHLEGFLGSGVRVYCEEKNIAYTVVK